MDAGCSVQLQHDAEETTWEEHGHVTLCTASGEVLAQSDNFQHNPFMANAEQRCEDFMANVPEPTHKQFGVAKVEPSVAA